MFPGATWDHGIDLIAVERAASGLGPCPELTEEEQRRAVQVMQEAGWGAVATGKRLGISERTVGRWLDVDGESS
ncbi:helix-turn-helix domain-containing protein [Streptomyces sp. NPDC053560]|uniref:helix-turn-helix domain-containing protein n=1 Tax=Streptomyces sp. NPDC053560 TaxID=3365711 RepID=UPI0037D6504B